MSNEEASLKITFSGYVLEMTMACQNFLLKFEKWQTAVSLYIFWMYLYFWAFYSFKSCLAFNFGVWRYLCWSHRARGEPCTPLCCQKAQTFSSHLHPSAASPAYPQTASCLLGGRMSPILEVNKSGPCIWDKAERRRCFMRLLQHTCMNSSKMIAGK